MESLIDLIRNDSVRGFHELLTVAFSLLACFWAAKLVCFFCASQDRLSTLLTREFVTDLINYAVTLAMGIFLHSDYSDGVWFLVMLRPYVILLNALALRGLYKHYRRM